MPIATEISLGHRLYRSSRHVGFALMGITVGVAVMIVTLCVVVGFRQSVSSRVAGFGAHIRVVNFENNNTYELQPISPSDSLIRRIGTFEHVSSVTPFITKPGILKTDTEVRGVILRAGDDSFFEQNLVRGAMPVEDNEVLISSMLARLLSVDVGDRLLCYFVGDQLRVRRITISGIYSTGFAEGDRSFLIATPAMLRRLNAWTDQQCSGLEIRIDRLAHLDEVADRVYFATANRLDEEGDAYYTDNLRQTHPAIFAWLDLLDTNVVVIIVLMLCVSGFSIVSALIILILNSLPFVGTMKALGASNRFLTHVFLTEAMMLVGRGLLYGNLLGFAICVAEYFFHFMPLDPSTYYVDFVPVAFPWGGLLALNLATAVISLIIMLLPANILTRISPARVLRFD